MAKGGKGYVSGRSGGFSFGKSSSSSYHVAPTPIPKIHNNIFSPPKKIDTPSKPSSLQVPTVSSSSLPVSSSSVTPSSGGFFSSMMDGFSFGTGSSIARNMVDRIFSPSQPGVSSIPISTISNNILPNKKCEEFEKSFKDCMNLHNKDMNMNICSKAFEDYESCKKNM